MLGCRAHFGHHVANFSSGLTTTTPQIAPAVTHGQLSSQRTKEAFSLPQPLAPQTSSPHSPVQHHSPLSLRLNQEASIISETAVFLVVARCLRRWRRDHLRCTEPQVWAGCAGRRTHGPTWLSHYHRRIPRWRSGRGGGGPGGSGSSSTNRLCSAHHRRRTAS